MKIVINDREIKNFEFTLLLYGATEKDYWDFADEDTSVELIDGVLIMKSPASFMHEDIFGFLHSLLRGFTSLHNLGKVLGSRFPLHFSDCRKFEPDIMFFKKENLHKITERQAIAPADLIIEILSTETREFDLNQKRRTYREAKTPECWFVDCEKRL
jgi:Uma2 family endonuclease